MAAEEIGQRRWHVHYSGRVQGVGFRYTVRAIATRHGVTGFVRNLPDGRVELVAEGPADEVRAFVAEIDGRLGRHIAGKQETIGPASHRFRRFEIRY